MMWGANVLLYSCFSPYELVLSVFLAVFRLFSDCYDPAATK